MDAPDALELVERVPQEEPEQPEPLRLQVTPFF